MPNESAANLTFEFDALKHAHHYRAALRHEFQRYLQGRVIEIGAGIGQFTELLLQLPAIKEVVAVEPEAAFCDQMRQKLAQAEVICGTSASLSTEANAIICVNVLEHIETDEQELEAYHRLLQARQGYVCLFVPARPEIYAPLDRDFGHYRRYTRDELQRKLTQRHFEIVSLRYFNSVGYLAWWFSFCLLKQRSFNERAVKLYDQVIFPVVYWWESRILSPPIGQSLLAIARAH